MFSIAVGHTGSVAPDFLQKLPADPLILIARMDKQIGQIPLLTANHCTRKTYNFIITIGAASCIGIGVQQMIKPWRNFFGPPFDRFLAGFLAEMEAASSVELLGKLVITDDALGISVTSIRQIVAGDGR